MKDAPIGFIAFVVVLMIGGILYFVSTKSDCDDRGGVLVKNAYTNLYECVRPLP
jgi:hypothetical protein